MSKEIPLTRGKVATVDDADHEWLSEYSWHASCRPKKWYAGAYCPKTRLLVYMHRLILAPGEGLYTDHKNGDGLDNRRCNLRVATMSQNIAAARYVNNKRTGFRGVWPVQSRNPRWSAFVTVKGRRFYLGCFRSPEAAARAYDAAALQHFGEFAALNFPKEGNP